MKVKSVFENHYSHFREIILNFHVSCDIIHIFESEWRKEMPVSYDRLWKVLIDKKMTRTDLKDTSGVSFNVIAKMGRNEYVSMYRFWLPFSFQCTTLKYVFFFPFVRILIQSET